VRSVRLARVPANDQLQCMIRPVGTFGVAPAAVGVAELRADMVTVAQGDATRVTATHANAFGNESRRVVARTCPAI